LYYLEGCSLRVEIGVKWLKFPRKSKPPRNQFVETPDLELEVRRITLSAVSIGLQPT